MMGTLSGDGSTGRHHCSFVSFVVLSFHQAGAVQAGANLSISINLAITEIPALPNPLDHAETFSKQLQALAQVVVSLSLHHSLSQTPSCPVKWQLASACISAFSKCSQSQHRRQPASPCISVFSKHAPSSEQVVVGLGLHCSLSQEFPSPAQVVGLISLCNLSQVVPSPTQVATGLSLYQRSTKAVPQSTHQMGSHVWHQRPIKEIPAPWVQPPNTPDHPQ